MAVATAAVEVDDDVLGRAKTPSGTRCEMDTYATSFCGCNLLFSDFSMIFPLSKFI